MNRRSFLTALGLAPAVAAVPALATESKSPTMELFIGDAKFGSISGGSLFVSKNTVIDFDAGSITLTDCRDIVSLRGRNV